MEIEETKLGGCLIIQPKIFKDNRGYFYESFNQKEFNKASGLDYDFIQDNHSCSEYGVLRGLHFQKGESAQTKLVRVVRGEVLDVAVDLRNGSKTYGNHVGVILSSENRKQMLIPKGFAHGFVVLSEFSDFLYKCDNYYDPLSEGGIHPISDYLNIDWLVPIDDLVISDKDKDLPCTLPDL